MPSGREKGKYDPEDLDDLQPEDLTLGVRARGEIEAPEPSSRSALAKGGGRLARWFKLRDPFAPTKPSHPKLEEIEEKNHESITWDSTAASSSNSKAKIRLQAQRGNDNFKQKSNTVASEQSRAAGEIKQPKARRRSSTPRYTRQQSIKNPESSSDIDGLTTSTPLQKLIIVETQEQNGRIKNLRDEMAEKLEEIREIKNLQVKNKVEETLASEIVEKQRADEEDLDALKVTIRQELEETRLKPFKEKLKLELEERLKTRQTQSRSDIEDMRTKINTEYANQAKVLILEYEKKVQRELKPALVDAKIKVRQEAVEERQRLEAFVRAQVTHDCQKIDEECDSRIEAINRERKERQLAARRKGQETVENHHNRPEKLQELDEKEKSAYSMVEIGEKERLQKQKDIIVADLAQRETLAIATLEREAAHKLALTKTIGEEQNRKKLQECIAEIEREVEARIKSEKMILAEEKRKFVDHRRSLLEKIVEENPIGLSIDNDGTAQNEKSEPAFPFGQQSQVPQARRDSVCKQKPLTQTQQEAEKQKRSCIGKQPGRRHPDVLHKGESSGAAEAPLDSADDSERPKRTLIEEEMLQRETKKAMPDLGRRNSSDLKASPGYQNREHNFDSKTGKVKRVLFEGFKSFKDPGNLHACTCSKDGHFTCTPLVDTAIDIIKQITERPRGRSFAHPHSRESIYGRMASEHIAYEEQVREEE